MKMFILSYKGGKDGGDIDKEDTSKSTSSWDGALQMMIKERRTRDG